MRPTILLVLAALLFFAPNSFAQDRDDREQETMIDERFSVNEGGTLEVNVGDADVEVVPGASDEVHVEVILAARNLSDKAREYFEKQNFKVTQSGNTVRVETDRRRRIRISWNDWRNHPSIYVRVSVPETFNADLHTSDGDIGVDHLNGDIRLSTSDGDVTVGELSGNTLVLSTSDGDIQVDALDGETIDIHTSDGDLDLGTITARSITARTSDGDIRVTSLNGDAEVKTSDGDIDIDAVNGPSFFARTSDGDITVGELIAGHSTVRSSDGDITLRRVEGDLNVSGSNANIRLDLYKPGAVTATTSDGDILITLPENHGADLRLRGDDVRISRSLDFDGRIVDDRATGEINGGGPLIEARTSDGQVTVRGN